MSHDEADLSEAIELIYDAALDPAAWDKALHRCCQLMDGAASQIYGMDLASRDCIYQIDHGLTERYKQEFARYFSRQSERNVLHQTRPDIDISYDYMMHDEQSIDRHPCYRFRQDHGFRYYVGGVLSRTPDVMILANVQRGPGQGHVTKTEIATFRLLKNHLARAVRGFQPPGGSRHAGTRRLGGDREFPYRRRHAGTQWPGPAENGGDKLVHGSGGISQPRAE